MGESGVGGAMAVYGLFDAIVSMQKQQQTNSIVSHFYKDFIIQYPDGTGLSRKLYDPSVHIIS